jgi:hypothetical protein
VPTILAESYSENINCRLWQDENLLSCRDVPDLDLVAASDSDPAAIGTEGHTWDHCIVFRQLEGCLPRGGIPDACKSIGTGRRKQSSIGAEGDGEHGSSVVPQGELFLSCGHIPNSDGAIRTGGGDPPAIGAEGHTPNLVGVAAQGQTS